MDKQSLSAVYFRRLARDAYKKKARPELLDTLKFAESSYKSLSAETHGFGGASHILAMANAEAAKEQAMLKQIFGVNINVDLSRKGAIKELTEAINTVFNFREIYERNKALLMDEKFSGQKGVFSYFHTYFIQAFRAALPGIIRDMKGKMLSNHSLKAGDAAKLAFEAATPRLINNAVKRMFGNADTELETMDPKYKNAYREILNFITKFPGQNVFTQGLAKAWGLDKVAEEFSRAFSKQRRNPGKKTIKKAQKAVEGEVSKSMHSKGGLSLETVVDQCLMMTAQACNTSNTHVAGVYTGAGSVEARPDNVFYFGVDGSRVDQAFQNIKDADSTRESAVNELSKLGTELNKVKDGFIVYVNDKNYTLNQNFKNRGMSAGTAWDLYQIEGLLGGIVGNIDQLVYNLLQTGADAIKAGDTDEASKILAEGIAYYLFDDYTTIGNPGGNAIHVMGLQGMLIPLSVFLFSLGKAIQTVEGNPSSYVKVTITPGPTDASDENSYFMENWDRQYEASMKETKIKINFISNFLDFVRGNL